MLFGNKLRTLTLLIFVFTCLSTFTTTLVSADEYENVHKCDEYAAHPNDPNRWASGVEEANVIPGPAVKYCREAVKDYPDTPRFKFQLGRSLWAAWKLDEGMQLFLKLEKESQYGPVYAYLADAYMNGIAGVDVDQELAISLYQIASEAGFSPAADVLAILSGEEDIQVVTQNIGMELALPQENIISNQQVAPSQPQEPKFEANKFSQPKILDALYSGNLSKLRNSDLGIANILGMKASRTLIYLNSFNAEFSGTYNFKDPTCIRIYDPAVSQIMEREMMAINFDNGGDNMAQNGLLMGFNMIMGMTNQLENGGVMSIVDDSHSLELLKQKAAADAAILLQIYAPYGGCQSQTIGRIYKNLVAYVKNRDGIASPEEKAKKIKIAEKKTVEVERRRQQALRNSAKFSCVGQFKKDNFCSCLIDGLDERNITEVEWKSLGQNFKEVLKIGKKYEGFATHLKSCRAK